MLAAGGSRLPRWPGRHSLSGVLAMKRWPAVILALTLSGALAVVFCPRVPGPDELIPPTETEALAEGFPETPALRMLAKKLIALEAAAGRRSLVEAAALFRELNRLPPEAILVPPMNEAFPRSRLPGRTDEERLCRQVVVYASVALGDGPPGDAEAAVARLEAEFFEEL